mmetsp:Transcript_2327/g.5333  ORF Transcript_2327/g.5333 Transcript_2327/m.5333 type:complete len:318 (+) Transcript_2327:45-998(+)
MRRLRVLAALASRMARRCCDKIVGCFRALSTCNPWGAWGAFELHKARHIGCSSCVAPAPEKEAAKPFLQEQAWYAAEAEEPVSLVVRAVSGATLFSKEGISPGVPVAHLLQRIHHESHIEGYEILQLCSGTSIVSHDARLGDCVAPLSQGSLELTLLKLPGPALEVEATSGRPIKVLDHFTVGDKCHSDRNYRFTSMGDFTHKPTMRYVLTSNEDKLTCANQVMWKLSLQVPATVYLNFRSESHVNRTGACVWLQQHGWTPSSLCSTVSTGYPNGPYSGPVYCKEAERGTVLLMGSNCEEGTYFVFVDLHAWTVPAK